MDTLLPDTETLLTRRTFVTTSLTAGFALAAGPVMAQTVIHTNAAGLTAGEVGIPAAGGTMPAYRAMPESGAGHPVVLVVHEIFGVHEYIKDICRRLAKEGYLAVAPELFARQGDVSKITDMQAGAAIARSVPDAQVLADLDAAATWAKDNGGDGSRLAITGFCWGGRIVWLYTAHNPAVDAGAAWYGRLVGDPGPLQPRHPVDVAADLKAPVLGLYGGQDGAIPLDTVEQMKRALAAAGKNSEFVVYPNAGHAFHADNRGNYRQEAAEDGWARMLAWFKRHGVAA